MTIYVLSGFNNYYNRIVKKFDTVVEYLPYSIHTQQNYNFVPNDNVNTQIVLGSNVNNYNGEGDYLLVVDDLNQITSRWFIIETVRDRAGQFTLTLHRDLVADHYDQVINSPMFIEKATLNESDPFILNKEPNFSVNQIKTNEYSITDETKVPWIIGFLNREWDGFVTGVEGEKTYSTTINFNNPPVIEASTQSLEQTDTYLNRSAYYTMWWKIELYVKILSTGMPMLFSLSSPGDNPQWTVDYTSTEDYEKYGTLETMLTVGQVLERLNSTTNPITNEQMIQNAYTSIPYKGSKTEYEENVNKGGQYISTDSGTKYYQISLLQSAAGSSWPITTSNDPTGLRDTILSLAGVTGTGGLRVWALQPSVSLEFTQVQQSQFTFTLASKGNREILDDAPYDMFCIPYNKVILQFNDNTSGETVSETNALSFAQQLAEKFGTNLYDLQLVPYCPMRYLDVRYVVDGESIIDLDESTGLIEGSDYTLQQIGNAHAIMFWSRTSSGSISEYSTFLKNTQNDDYGSWTASTNIPQELTQYVGENVSRKITNECNMFRLCSPNYNGTFEFNTSKMNEGNWVGYSVDYTYLPYSSYIHVNPTFSGLYGSDFNDARGLICQGDFSISYLSDAWTQYQINNKNYANIFNRQIQNMETTQSVERDMQVFNAITGTVMGGAGGAAIGSKTGTIAGTVLGGVLGTAASAAGGALDVHYGDILRSEALDYKKDMFGYQLDNIKALPDSIAKVTAYNENNKLFPILEFYTCTPEERRAFANKVAWNGMTVMRIGTMSEFIYNNWKYGESESQGYIKGKLIRLDTINDDYHIVNALSGELDKGVYIK